MPRLSGCRRPRRAVGTQGVQHEDRSSRHQTRAVHDGWPNARARQHPTAAGEPSARVELSSQATRAGNEASRADFDSDKVQRIAQAIRDGKFQVNADAIADKLIANAQELLPKAPH